MKRISILLLTILFAGCASNTGSRVECPPEVQAQSQADRRLFADIAWGMAGVGFMDQTYFPGFALRKITKIERLATSDGKSQGVEEWTVEHVGGGSATYVVKIIPDGKGGAYFSSSLKKPIQPPQTTTGSGAPGRV